MNVISDDISIALLVNAFRQQGRQIFRNVCIASLAAMAFMFTIPDYYRCDDIVYCEQITSLAKDFRNVGIAKGFDIGHVEWNSDMIYPIHYFRIVNSNEFMSKVLASEVQTSDGEHMTYYTYLKSHPQETWLRRLSTFVSRWYSDEEMEGKGDTHIDPFHLTKAQRRIVDKASKQIICQANVKLNTFTISVFDQDPLICADMAGKIQQYLQEYMVSYRHSKLLSQVNYYRQMALHSQDEYEEAVAAYNQFAQGHTSASLASSRIWADDLYNQMMQKYTILKAINVYLDNSNYLLSEPTKLFTQIQNVAIPVEKAGPRRLVTVLIVSVFAVVASLLYYIRGTLFQHLFH